MGPQETTLGKYEQDLIQLKNQMKSFQEELGTELLSQLSRADQDEVRCFMKCIQNAVKILRLSFLRK